MFNKNIIEWLIISFKKYSWAPVLVLIIHVISITVFRIYKYWPEFDTPMHIAGGLSAAYFLSGAYLEAGKQKLTGQASEILRYILVFCGTSTVTILWEYAELFSDRYLGTRVQGGVGETLLDMFFGMLGAVLALLLFHKNSKH